MPIPWVKRFLYWIVRRRLKRLQAFQFRPPIATEFLARMGDKTALITVLPDDNIPLIVYLCEMFDKEYQPPEDLVSRAGITYLTEHRFKRHPVNKSKKILHITFHIAVEDVVKVK